MSSRVVLRSLLPLALLACACATGPGEDPRATEAQLAGVVPPQGAPLVVSADLRLEPGDYLRPDDGGQGVLRLEGRKGVTLDLRGVRMRGASAGAAPDDFAGAGLVLRDCEDVRVLGGSFGGYRIAVRVEGCDGVSLEGLTVDPAAGDRLEGSEALPHPHDRLELQSATSEHWLEAYGAAIAVVDSSRVEVRGARVRGGQNGLVVLRSEGCRFVENDLSYLSGWGIALSHADGNLIAGNRCDVVTRRGSWSGTERDHGATGILLTGASSGNVIAGNSARGGSAGGRERFEAQSPGSDNRWVANDFSRSACVGLELRNARGSWAVGNRIVGARGAGLAVWGGVSLLIEGNTFDGVFGEGLSLAGGEHLTVVRNGIRDCDLGLVVSAGAHDVDAPRHLRLEGNRFEENIQDLVLEQSVGLELLDNDFEAGNPPPHLDGLAWEGEPELTGRAVWSRLADAEGHLPSGRCLGARLRTPASTPPTVLSELATWSSPAPFGELPNQPAARRRVGEEPTVMGPFGPWDPAGGAPRPSAGGARGLLAGARWQTTWFRWGTESDPRGDLEAWRARRFEPLARAEVDAWCDPWGGDQARRLALPVENFGLVARTTIEVPRDGTYQLRVVSDDGVRLSVDDEPVLEDWTWQAARQRTAKIELVAGSHELFLEYFQIDGPAVLSLELAARPGP